MKTVMTSGAAAAMLLAASHWTPVRADVLPFTWDPSKAVPALVPGPAAFTADSVQWTNFNRTVNVNDLTTLKQTVTADQYETVTGFTLGGSPVAAPGLNSAYGLYFHLVSVFSFPLNSGGTIIGPATFTSLSLSLVADVNHDDGVLSTSAAGIGFSNPSGVANDVTLATGSLIAAALSNNPDGSRHALFLTSFVPETGEGGFFVGPSGPVSLLENGDSAAASFALVPIDSTTFLTLVNGNLGSAGAAQLVPEPGTIGLLAAAVLGLGHVRRRRGRAG